MADQAPRTGAAHLLHLPTPLLEHILRLLSHTARDWAAACLTCRELRAAGQAVGVLPLIEASERSLPALCKAAVRRRRCASGSGDPARPLCRRLVVGPASVRGSGHQLRGLLCALAGPAAPEELSIHWQSGWQYGERGPNRVVHLLHSALGALGTLRRLDLQLRYSGGRAVFFGGLASGLQSLQELRLEFDSPRPHVELHAAAFPALTCLALAHAHPATQMPEPASTAVVIPALLPALRRLELRSWHAIAVVRGTMGERLAVEEVVVEGPCLHQHYGGVAPAALSLARCLRMPHLDYGQLRSLRLSRVETLETLDLMVPPPMPALAALRVGQGVGRPGQVEALLAACCATLAPSAVSRAPGTLPFKAFCAARGLNHWGALMEREEEGVPGAVGAED